MHQHAPFTHLHLHTEYSLLDGAIRLKDLFVRAKEHKLPSLAMTDHGAMYGVVDFHQYAEKAGIKPIIGCETYVAPGKMTERSAGPDGETSHHLLLLCRNEVGYRNLCRLVSAAHQRGFYYKPRIDKELLAAHSEGLMGLTACMAGEVPRAILKGDFAKARRVAEEYSKIFGPDNFWLEIQENGIPEQKVVNAGLVELADSMGLGLVATNDCHYLDREDAKSHEVLVCIQTGKTMADEGRMKMSTDAFYLRSPAEMAELFSWRPDAIANTIHIAERCNVEIKFGKYHFPKYHLDREETPEDAMCRLARAGLSERLEAMGADEATAEKYRDRLEEELRLIRKMEFAGYFLIVQDFINWAKNNGVPVGPGRGSAAGCLVAYALRITDIDPIPYDLLFERFLNPERISMPDIDVDFCFENRGKVIKYVSELYGSERVAQITTFGKMLARAVIRDVGRVLDVPYGEVDRIAKLVPAELGITLVEAIKKEPKLKELMDGDARINELMIHAQRLEGLNRHASTHAAGIVIGESDLTDFLPVYTGKEGETVTQFAMKAVEAIGLVKFDFLGLKTLTVIQNAVEMINRRLPKDGKVDISRLPLNDPKVFELLGKGETTGVFQLESSGMKELMVNLKPTVFEDIIALVALYRPGPLGSGMVEDFIKRKHGKTKIVYDFPQLEPILKDTYGVIVYQEQVMKIAQVLANYSLGEADLLRRAMGKKIAEEMAKQKDRFMKGAAENKLDPDKAGRIFDLMAMFAEYGFNKSHSAAYALVSYQTAWLKAHHPVEFMASLLTNDRAHSEKIVKNIAECREMGIEVLQPDVNESDLFFTVANGQIRFGMAAVKNVGEAALESVLAARGEGGPFKGLYDFCERVDMKKVNRKVLESLITCGAFDSLGGFRSQYLAALDAALDRAGRRQKEKASAQTNLFSMLAPPPAAGAGATADTGDDLPNIPDQPAADKLQAEKELLGFYLSGHPLKQWTELLATHTDATLGELDELTSGAEITVGGSIAAMREITTKSGDRMAFVTIEDMEGQVEVIVFPKTYAAVYDIVRSDQPILVRGTLEKTEDGQAKLRADRIVAIAAAQEELTRTVRIRVNAGMHEEADMDSLRSLLADPALRGQCPVFLDILIPGKAQAVVKLPGEYKVAPTGELRNRVRALFGADVVTYR